MPAKRQRMSEIKRPRVSSTKRTTSRGKGWGDDSALENIYVVFARLYGISAMAVGQLAASQQILMNNCDRAQVRAINEIISIHSSVYGRFLCVRSVDCALKAAKWILDDCTKSGVRLSVGV